MTNEKKQKEEKKRPITVALISAIGAIVVALITAIAMIFGGEINERWHSRGAEQVNVAIDGIVVFDYNGHSYKVFDVSLNWYEAKIL